MSLPIPKTAFLSVSPLEPVLVFSSPHDAATFQLHYKQSRIIKSQNPCWVFLPLPQGLLRVRTAKGGDVAFDFESATQAATWDKEVGQIGRVFKGKEKVVYVGFEKGQ
jgi:hypothetical protein